MKKVVALAFVFLALAFAASPQDDEMKPNQEADRQAISNLEQGFAHAIQLNNSTIFNTVFSDDFYGVTWYGEVINKTQQIRLIQTSSNSYQFVHASDIQVKIFRDVASVLSLRSERGTSDGRAFSRQFRVLHVYINTPRGWRVIASQETQLPTQISR
jgi:ketosteroid isomerase-like protein